MTEIILKNLQDHRYGFDFIRFTADGVQYRMPIRDALEIVYTVFDLAGRSYDELDDIYRELGLDED